MDGAACLMDRIQLPLWFWKLHFWNQDVSRVKWCVTCLCKFKFNQLILESNSRILCRRLNDIVLFPCVMSCSEMSELLLCLSKLWSITKTLLSLKNFWVRYLSHSTCQISFACILNWNDCRVFPSYYSGPSKIKIIFNIITLNSIIWTI